MRTFLSENCSRVRPKRSLERGSFEGLGMPSNSKRLTVDHDHPHYNPQMKKMKLGSERWAISPLKFPGQLAPSNTKCRSTERLVFHGKEAVKCTEKRPRRKIEMRPPKPIRDAVFIRIWPDSSQEMQLNVQNKQVSSFEPRKDSRPSQIQREILFCKQTPGRLDHVSSSRCEVLSSGKYVADRRPLVEMRCMDNEGMKMGFKVVEAALKVSENDLENKIGLSIAESRNLKVTRFDKFKPVTPASEKRMEDPEETGIVCTSQINMERPKLRCQFSGGSSYGAKCHVRRTSHDYSEPKSSIHISSSIVHSPKKSRPSQFQRGTVFSKQAPGRLDRLSSTGCEVLSSGKYAVDRRPLVEMRCMDNEGMKMGFKVDDAALKVSENDLENKIGLCIAESRNLKVTRFDKFKPVTPASEKRMEDPEETGIVFTSQINMERPKLRCQFSGGSSYGAKCHVRRTSHDYSEPKSSIHISSSIVHSPKKSRPAQFQRGTVLAPGRLDPLSSTGCEVLSSGKYDADRRPLVEMICINNEGTKMGFKVDEGALEISENDLRHKVGLGIAESGNLKVTRFDKFKPVTPASEKRMEDPEETGIVCTSQSNIERPKFRCQSAGGSSVRVADKHKASPAVSLTPYDSEGRKNEISSADKIDYLGFEADKAKASKQNFAGRQSSTRGKIGMVGLSDNSGIHNSYYAFRAENDTSNIPYNQENCCEKVRNLNSAPYNDHQVGLYSDEVREVLDLYKETVERLRYEEKIKQKGKGTKGMQIYVDAAMQLKEQHKWLNMQKCIGAVPGVEVGYKFHRRAELVIIGLHSKFVAGIDFKKIDGTLYATSIVASGRYGDKNDSSDVLIYVGEGGNTNSSSEKLEDQKLVRGNLALKNSIDKVPVRVIRSIQNVKAPKSMHANTMDKSKYYYDGLYFVRKCWPERERCGNLVFKFRLERIQGQKDLSRWNTKNTSRKSNKASHGPLVVHDIARGKENVPIPAVNAIDCEKPPPFEYTTKMMYHPQQCVISKPTVCDCLTGCVEDVTCSCIIKNNCEVSVNKSVSIVYECGPLCKCPPDCKNRTTQHGMKLQLEVFKATPKEWGVRSRNFISQGRFICEYVGELLQYNQEKGRIDFDKSAIDPRNPNDAENVKFGNVGRFIRHSCSPNLYAKCVLFDHEDKGRPHVMLFSAKNIPPGKEFTFDYKLW